jgi:hypothetical protein
MKIETRIIFAMVALMCLCLTHQTLAGPVVGGCQVLPVDNIWNTRVDTLPVDSNSAAYVASIGTNTGLHPDFGSDPTWGIPYVVVPGTQPMVTVTFTYADECDPGPYPIPPNPPIEGGSGTNNTGDRHILIVNSGNHKLYELWSSYSNADGTWHAGSGAIFDLNSNAPLRPDGWTSSDAAGLPVLPGLVRYDEVAAGAIEHAIRLTAVNTQKRHIWPARHDASSLTGTQYTPMGQRFRLKSNYNISSFSPAAQTILIALKKYGMIMADNGSNWYISGAPDTRWDDNVLNELKQVKGRDFEALDSSALMLNYDSGAVLYPRAQVQQMSLTSGICSLTINYLFPGVSNVVERNFDLRTDQWHVVNGFLCDSGVTNWSSVASNNWNNVFYRIRRL